MSDVEVVASRDVPLGGPRAMTVRRTLPQRTRSLVGAWCFVDHYGPDDVTRTGGMDVPPHPHTGLQTVSWLFRGEIEHRDSSGVHALVRPGELNLMTGGYGVAHSEVSTRSTTTLHGVQLWVALPDTARHVPRNFVHHVPTPTHLGCGSARVMLGALAGQTSPVATHTPLVGVELVLDPHAELTLDVPPEFEHGVLVDLGPVLLEGTKLARAELGYLPPGPDRLRLANPGSQPARVMLLGGAPFTEPVLMWWNFIGRTHEEIAGSGRNGKGGPNASAGSRGTAARCNAYPRRRCPRSASSSGCPHPPQAIPAPGDRRRTHAPRRAHRPGRMCLSAYLVGREGAALEGDHLEVPLEQPVDRSGARVTALLAGEV